MSVKRIVIVALVVVAAILLGLGATLYYASLPIRTPRDILNIAQLEDHVERLVRASSPPALEITVMRGGALLYDKEFGRIGPDEKRAPKTGDVYHYWSITKLVTAVAVLQLAERRRLDLDDPLSSYVPKFHPRLRNGQPANITIRQLLSHTSGIADLKLRHLIGWIHGAEEPPISQTDLAETRLKPYETLRFRPGTQTRYSNTGYILLGAVIEAASGLSYEDYVRRNILEPLGMESAGFVYAPELADRTVAGSQSVFHIFTPILLLIHPDWFKRWVARVDHGRMWFVPMYTDYSPPTSLLGTGMDLARFGQAIVNGGELDGRRILSPESVRMMIPANAMKAEDTSRREIGLGWQAWDTFIGHSGGGPGFATQLSILKDGTVIVLLANDTSLDREGLTRAVAMAIQSRN